MLERLWREGNPLTLSVGIQPGTATMENSVEIKLEKKKKNLKKLEKKKKLPCDPANPLLGIHMEETRIERDTVYNS